MKSFVTLAAAAFAVLLVSGSAVTVSAEETTAVQTTTSAQSSTTAIQTTTAAQTTATAAQTTTAAVTTEITQKTVTPGWEEQDGNRYYRLEDGSLAVGEQEIDGKLYRFGYSGAEKTDWQTIGEKRWYFDPQSGEPVYGWVDYFGDRYYISRESGKLTGVQTIGEEHYVFEQDGSLLTGWFNEEGQTYYADPETGLCTAGLHSSVGDVFFTDESGAIVTGWQEQDGKRWYVPENGIYALYGLFSVDGTYYLGRPDGLVCGEYWLDGEQYYFDEESGALQTGWYLLDGERRYFDPALLKTLRSAFADIDGSRYYFDEDGAVYTGLLETEDALYLFAESGEMLTGMQTVDGLTYYFDEETGQAITGALETEEGTIRFGQDHAQLFGWEITDETAYYTDEETGLVVEGWQTLPDTEHETLSKEFKFDESGEMISDGRLYNQFDPKWKEVKFGTSSSSSMYSSACGIFSFCNAIFALNHIEADAVEVAQWAISVKAFRPGGGGTYREILYNNIEQKYGESLRFTLGAQCWGKITDSRLKAHLLGGGVAVIHVSGHFMAVTGYDEATGLYHVLESACSTKRGLAGDSWVDAKKMTSGYTNVDWFVLISPRPVQEEVPVPEEDETE